MPDPKDIASGAASGAAVGTGISPGVGTVIGAGIGAFGSLLGGVLGNKAQQKANKTNLQIAREQNETQRQLAAENNRLQREMFERQLFYNSAGAQRKMLEDAGINPYSMVQNGYQALSAPTAPQMQLPSFTTPQVIPENAFAQNLGTVGRDYGEVMKNLADAGLAKSQKVGQEIDNTYSAAIKEADLVGKGMSNTAQAIQNYINEQSKDWQVETKYQEAQLSQANAKKAFNDAGIAALNHQLLAKYGDKVYDTDLQKKLSEINLIDTQRASELLKQGLTSAQINLTSEQARLLVRQVKAQEVMASAQYKGAIAQMISATAADRLSKAQAGLLHLQAEQQKELNRIIKVKANWFEDNGYLQLSAQLRQINADIEKNNASIEQLESMAKMFDVMSLYYTNQAEYTSEQTDWLPFDKTNELIRSISGVVSAGSSAAGSIPGMMVMP